MVTNGPLVRELEAAAAERLGTEHAVAVASCTSGLILTVQAVAGDGDVVMPSFTFSASAHAVAWNDFRPHFVECDPDSLQFDLDAVAAELPHAGALLLTHVFGAPGPLEDVTRLAEEHDVPLLFDAAHAFGSRRAGRPVATFGRASVFSLTPTKPLVAGEGGIVATDDAELAATIRIGRDYGNPGNYDTQFVGLNARMSEMHAATALESLETFDAQLDRRQAVARAYRTGLARVPGVRVQHVDTGDRSTWKDFTIRVGPELGLTRDALVAALSAEGIDTRCYFSPPVHRQRAYRAVAPRPHLPVTDEVADSVISLPMFPELGLGEVEAVVDAIARIHAAAEELAVVAVA